VDIALGRPLRRADEEQLFGGGQLKVCNNIYLFELKTAAESMQHLFTNVTI